MSSERSTPEPIDVLITISLYATLIVVSLAGATCSVGENLAQAQAYSACIYATHSPDACRELRP